MNTTAVYAITPKGAQLGKSIAGYMNADFFLPPDLAAKLGAISYISILELVKKNFSLYSRHIFILSAGIVVRAISPHLKSKLEDPAVVVLDQEGRFCISLLSGHLGGANSLAKEVAIFTGGMPVITTATDTAGVFSMDVLAKENNLNILNPEAIKHVNMAMLTNKPLMIYDKKDMLGLKDKNQPVKIEWAASEDELHEDLPGVRVTFKSAANPSSRHLILHPKCLIAGVGCNRGTLAQEILLHINNTFEEYGLSLKSLKCIATIDAKKDETGLLDTAIKLNVPIIFLTSDEIKTIKAPHPSNLVEQYMGVNSVCEAAAMFVSGRRKLLVPKLKTKNTTLAIAIQALA